MSKQNAAQRRYTVRLMITMTAYAAALTGAKYLINSTHPTGLALGGLSLLPALPLLGAIAVMGLYLKEERDEYIRAQLVSGVVIATGLTLAFCTVWGFLEEGLLVSHRPAWMVFPIWCAALGLAQGGCEIRSRIGGRP